MALQRIVIVWVGIYHWALRASVSVLQIAITGQDAEWFETLRLERARAPTSEHPSAGTEERTWHRRGATTTNPRWRHEKGSWESTRRIFLLRKQARNNEKKKKYNFRTEIYLQVS